MISPTPAYGRKHQRGTNWITTIALVVFHAGALAAFAFMDIGAMLVALVLYVVAGMLGIGMGYHRLLTHRAYKTPKTVEYFLTWCATLALPPPEARDTAELGRRHGGLNGPAYAACTLFLPGKSSRKSPLLPRCLAT